MKKLTPVLVAGALVSSLLAGCSPSALQAAVAAAAAADGKSGAAQPGAGTAPTGPVTAPAGGSPTAPAGGTTPTTGTGAGPAIPLAPTTGGNTAPVAPKPDDSARKAKFDAFKALVDQNSGDSRMTARLFVYAFTQYAKDKDLALAMMTSLSSKGDLRMNPESLSGYSYIQARDIYWLTVDKNPANVLRHIKGGQEAADSANAIDSVIIDDDYAAASKGEFEPGAKAKYYFFTYPIGQIRSRPVSLVMEDGKWKVSEFSSITV